MTPFGSPTGDQGKCGCADSREGRVNVVDSRFRGKGETEAVGTTRPGQSLRTPENGVIESPVVRLKRVT